VPWMNAFTCAAVAPVAGVRPWTFMTSALLRLVIRTKLPACHVPLMLLFATSTHAFTEAPPLLPTLTEMARWNDAGGTIVGCASVLFVMWADTLIDDPAAELNKS